MLNKYFFNMGKKCTKCEGNNGSYLGKIVDATINEVPKGRKREDGSNTRDEDASFPKKNSRSYHGYKGHIPTDTKGKFIQAVFTSTSIILSLYSLKFHRRNC